MMQSKIIRDISVTDWCTLAKKGAAPPITILLEGSSMQPLIRRGKDLVTIAPLQRLVKKGDVVLFMTDSGRYVVHRVWKMKEKMVRTLGDNCVNPDAWIPNEYVLGQAICYSRNGRKYRLDTCFARLWGRVWMAIFPLRVFYIRLRKYAGCCYRKLFKTCTGGDGNE